MNILKPVEETHPFQLETFHFSDMFNFLLFFDMFTTVEKKCVKYFNMVKVQREVVKCQRHLNEILDVLWSKYHKIPHI